MSSQPTTIAELQELAEQVMSPDLVRFVRRGAFGNWTVDRNRRKLDEIAVNPRLLRDVSRRDLSTTVLGRRISFPVMCAPAGGQCFSHPDGELATARAAGAAGTLMALPVGSGYSIGRLPGPRPVPSGSSTSTTAMPSARHSFRG